MAIKITKSVRSEAKPPRRGQSHQVTGLKNKRILITAGPTWVPIDSVRVITNIASGETGCLLAEKFIQQGAKVTLLLGPVSACCLNKNIKVIPFKFFDELKDKLNKEIRANNFAAVIHSAAVSDYQPKKPYASKVRSGIKEWRLNLVPTEKIIDLIKKADPSLLLVGFKFETNISKTKLIKAAQKLIQRAKADLAIANTISNNQYKAYIVQRKRVLGPWKSKDRIADSLIKSIGAALCQN